jgi:hypothetical protein
MEVRSASDWVTTPRPYWTCLMYWLSGVFAYESPCAPVKTGEV